MTMLQPADGARLALEAGDGVRRRYGALVQELDGDQLAQLDALGPVDDAHATDAELIDDFPTPIDHFARHNVARRRLARHRPPV